MGLLVVTLALRAVQSVTTAGGGVAVEVRTDPAPADYANEWFEDRDQRHEDFLGVRPGGWK